MSKIDFNLWPHEDKKDTIDFQEIKGQAQANIAAILEAWLPGGKIVQNEYQCGSIYGGKGDSCSTNLNTGVGSDFATGQAWGDLIDLVAQSDDVAPIEAARKLRDFIHGGGFDTRPIPVIPKQSPEERYAIGQRSAVELWLNAEVIIPSDNEYLMKKQITPSSEVKYNPLTKDILVPLKDENGVVWNVQRINPDGTKKGVHCGKISGTYHIIMPDGGKHDIIYICEGYATAQTVALITRKMSVMAVSAGNLGNVAEKIARLHPTSKIIIAADNDNATDGNPGIKAANEAVKRIGKGCVIAPPAAEGQSVDWNDYAISHGARTCQNLLFSLPQKPMFLDIAMLEEIEQEWLIEDILVLRNISLIFGPSGAGKSFLALDWAFHVALGKTWHKKAVKKGGVLYFCGEGRSGIIKRRKAWEHEHGVKIPANCFQMSESTVTFDAEGMERVVLELQTLAEGGFHPVMIIIDTMARSMSGDADENSVKDTMLFLNMCGMLQDTYGAHVMPIHHSGHSDNKRARGSSAIRAALDAEICIIPKSKKDGVIEWTKTKDYEAPLNINYLLKNVDYGNNRHQSSLVMTYDFEYTDKSNKLGSHSTKALEALGEAVALDGLDDRCLIDTWRSVMTDKLDGCTGKSIKSILANQLKWMEDNNMAVKSKIHLLPIQSQEEVTQDMFTRLSGR